MTEPSLVLPDAIRTQWPYRPRFARVNGWRMHYVDEGAGDPVVLLHCNPTWGFLYRDFVGPLPRTGHRVIIPDMIGFGLSEKPAREDAHSLDGHIATLTALLRGLDLTRITLVCHDWGGPTGLGFALSNLARVRALVLMSTWAWPLPPAEFHTHLFPWRMMHAPMVAPYLMGRHNVLVTRGIYLSVVDRAHFRERAQAAYEAVMPDPASRLLTWTWPRWIPLDQDARALERFVWLDSSSPHVNCPRFSRGDARTTCSIMRPSPPASNNCCRMRKARTSSPVGHFLQEDSGSEIAALIVDFLKRLAQTGRGRDGRESHRAAAARRPAPRPRARRRPYRPLF